MPVEIIVVPIQYFANIPIFDIVLRGYFSWIATNLFINKWLHLLLMVKVLHQFLTKLIKV